jgi:hypothetical protein
LEVLKLSLAKVFIGDFEGIPPAGKDGERERKAFPTITAGTRAWLPQRKIFPTQNTLLIRRKYEKRKKQPSFMYTSWGNGERILECGGNYTLYTSFQ